MSRYKEILRFLHIKTDETRLIYWYNLSIGTKKEQAEEEFPKNKSKKILDKPHR